MEGFFNFVSLEQKTRYTLGKTERLKSRKEIEQLFKTGKSLSVYPFRILYLFKELSSPADSSCEKTCSPLQAGFAVSSRNFKKATDRNRVKRLMREAWRLQKNELKSLPSLDQQRLSVFVIYIGKELPGYEMVFEKISLVFKRLTRLADENN